MTISHDAAKTVKLICTPDIAGSAAQIWNTEGCEGLQQMLYLLHVSWQLIFVETCWAGS